LSKSQVTNVVKKAYFLGDIHAPFENKALIRNIAKSMTVTRPNYIALVGDLMDLPGLSAHLNHRDIPRVEDEIEAGRAVLELLRDAAGPDCEIHVKEGNHDQRMEKNLMRKAPELMGLKALSWDNLLRLDELNIRWYKTGEWLVLPGNLKVTHGVKCGQKAGYSAQQEMATRHHGYSGVSGHVHRLAWVRHHNNFWCEAGWLGSPDPRDFPYVQDSQPDWHPGFLFGYLTETREGDKVLDERWVIQPVEAFGPKKDKFFLEGNMYE